MRAFINTPVTKQALLEQLRAHQIADEIVKGRYWDNGKGCAVGCCIHDSNHLEFEKRFGIDARIAFLMDDLFESLPNAKAKDFPITCIEAIPEGAYLSKTVGLWLTWMLADPVDGLVAITEEPSVHKMAELFKRSSRGDEPSETEWDVAAWAESAAWSIKASAKFVELLKAAPITTESATSPQSKQADSSRNYLITLEL